MSKKKRGKTFLRRSSFSPENGMVFRGFFREFIG
jgi:hypothetical protein